MSYKSIFRALNASKNSPWTLKYKSNNFMRFLGKGENIWDNFTHRIPTTIFDSSSGDVACDSYNRYQVDIQLMKSMGVRFKVF